MPLPTPARRPALAGAALLLVAAAAPAAAQGSGAPLRLATVFADGMVVQQGARLPVWGTAAPGARVTVRLDARTARAVADTAGRWEVAFPALAAGPTAHVIVAEAAGARVEVRDVVAGDVWVAAGQSNMEWPLAQATDGPRDAAASRDSLLRELKVPIAWSEMPAAELAGARWSPADSAHAGAFSAVAFHFGRELRAARRIPIGIVNVTWGGSGIETWVSTAAQGLPADGGARAMAAERARLETTRQRLVARFGNLRTDAGMAGGRAAWADPALDDADWKRVRVPGYWEAQEYDNLDGVAWYRTTFTLTAEEAARGARLSLGAIDDNDVTWVNGVEVGRTEGYNTPRRYAVPASALRAGRNVLAVRVSDYGGGGGIAASNAVADSVRLELAGGGVKTLAGEWRFRIGEIGLQMDGQRINKVPAVTYNAMVHPLLRFPVRGVIWYQGESNANDEPQARAYGAQLRTLVTSWRREWGSGRDIPFLWVQLPNLGARDTAPSATGGSWALHREATTRALALPATGQAVTIDVGDPDDIHPRDKQPVGHRLALLARRVAYGEPVRAAGPTYRSHAVANGRVTVRFANADDGLVARGGIGGAGGSTGFAIAGADRRWVWAHARVERDRVVLWHERVPKPVAVRYAWEGNPPATLFNRDGLPAAPFRTDTW